MEVSKMKHRFIEIIKNPYIFSIISEGISIISVFLFTVFQARFLGAEIKGQVATITSMLSIVSIVFGFGISQTYPYFRKKDERNMQFVFVRIAMIFLFLYMAGAVFITIFADINIKYVAVMLITPLKIYDQIISEVVLIENPNKRNGVNNFVYIVELLFVLTLWFMAKASLVTGVVILVFEIALRCVIFTWWLRKAIFKTNVSIQLWFFKLIKFGLFPMMSVLMSSLNYRLDVLMLNDRVPDTAIGIYSVGVLLADRIWLVPDAMKGVMLSNITKGKSNSEVAYVMRICNTICLILIIGIILIGEPFINFVFGEEYKGAYKITLILILGVFPMIAYKIIAAFNIILGRQKVSFVLLSISVGVNIIANYIFIPIHGIYGAGLASVISYGICSLMFIIDYCRFSKVPLKDVLLINATDIKSIKSSIMIK